ncbi:sirohydrochlorin chelatase [cf. Phormidesmis sp. LEGE 11477]|uniref:sirohydrochlorin chelatase n=1 Tax=cf. Phormidesmis sp. LEGE 11477 TaxID=1828680 RepID=UPI00187E7A22|nr:CbiX/SirB N-terminal domain-containing protein [cf. Phormidesmis sp. LEGE 11477]MBE9062616.1 sirohydrochlorin chelatase [cf. Phormidesmis sp. LEGE 11477]
MKPVVASTAYLLISHGSRDPRPQEAMNRLADLVRSQLESALRRNPRELDTAELADSPTDDLAFDQQAATTQSATSLLTRPRTDKLTQVSSEVIVGTACLELATLPLSEQIYEFGRRLRAAGIKELKLIPVFLMSGVHVMEDIPQEIETAKKLLEESLQLTLCPHLGSHEDIALVLGDRLSSVEAEGAVLVAHGSRRKKGNRAIQELTRRIDPKVKVAYWATPPDIETQVIELMQQGCQRLTILPYFLFSGGITDAIAHRTEELAERFPKIQFRLLPTLGATEELADLIVNIVST